MKIRNFQNQSKLPLYINIFNFFYKKIKLNNKIKLINSGIGVFGDDVPKT